MTLKLNDAWGPYSEYGVLNDALLKAAVADLIAQTVCEEVRGCLASYRIIRKYVPAISKQGGCVCSH